jgi:2-methylcitrate dehydratase PrpD
MSLIERLAKHLVRPVAKHNRDRARLHLLDWLGCVAGARRSEIASVARRAEPDVLTRAALLGNAFEMDDVHRAAILHPGPVVWPSVLSAVRDEGADLDRLLEGAVRGYEAMIAIGSSLDAFHYARWHNSATAGGFGAAAAAASVYDLAPEQYASALGNAGSLAGGLWRMRHEAVMTKQLHVAHAALSGLWFARLARHGFTGPAGILEGEQGFYAAMTAEPRPLRLDGDGWCMEQVSFKPWAACRHAHPAIDAALELKAAGALHGPVRVETYADAVKFCDRAEPANEAEAKFSIQHSIAVVMLRGEPQPADFEDPAEPQVAAARNLVTVVEAPEYSARYPEHFGARVTAGERSAELADARGDPERPMSAADIEAKARSLIAWGGAGNADHAIDVALHHEGGIAPLLALLEEWL